MPSIVFRSRLRTATEHVTLTMTIEHRLDLGHPSDSVQLLKPPPESLLVFLASRAKITISGTVNNAQVPSDVISESHIARHFAEYLCLNADDLGINAVTNIDIPEDTNMPTLSFTGCRPSSADLESAPLHAILLGFNVRYQWQLKDRNSFEDDANDDAMGNWMNPFSPHLSLPYLTMVNNAVERFTTFHVVKRYPLIFGAWQKQLALETTFFSSIYVSIQNIILRSSQPEIYATFNKLLKLCKRRIQCNRNNVVSALSIWLGEDVDFSHRILGDEEIFSICMDELYRLGMRRAQFKGKSSFCNMKDTEPPGEDIQIDLDHSTNAISESNTDLIAISGRPFGTLDEAGNLRLGQADYSEDLNYASDQESFYQTHCSSSSPHKIISVRLAPNVCGSWPSGYRSGESEPHDDIYELSNMDGPSLPLKFIARSYADVPYRTMFRETSYEGSAIHDNLEPSLCCDWSADIGPSHEKASYLSMGDHSKDNSNITKIDLCPLQDVPTVEACIARPQGEDNVEEVPIFHSVNDIIPGSEVMDDHGIMNFEDEYPSVAFASENGDARTGSFSNKDRPRSTIPHVNGEQIVALGTCMAGMEHSFLQETSKGAKIPSAFNLLIIDFD